MGWIKSPPGTRSDLNRSLLAIQPAKTHTDRGKTDQWDGSFVKQFKRFIQHVNHIDEYIGRVPIWRGSSYVSMTQRAVSVSAF